MGSAANGPEREFQQVISKIHAIEKKFTMIAFLQIGAMNTLYTLLSKGFYLEMIILPNSPHNVIN